jgi:hypothetical protein
MTDNQIQYSLNAKKSIKLCQHMVRLIESVEFHKDMLNVAGVENAEYELSQIKNELDAIWSDQVDLFFAIKYERERLKTKVFMESIRVQPGKSLKHHSKTTI